MKTQLPEEIIALEILARLPVKSLMRFKCVSKSWYALIQNPKFINAHRVFHNDTLLLVNGVKRGEEGMLSIFRDETLQLESYFDLPFPLKDGTDYVVRLVSLCSINGIICLLPDNSTVIIMNPSTRESKVTRRSDPSSDYTFNKDYGFGYDPIADDYKVVRLVWRFYYDSLSRKHSVYQLVEVYSLRSDCWRKLDNAINWCMQSDCCRSVFVNGMIHWSSYENRSYATAILLSFDMSTELFYSTVLPCQEGFVLLARMKESIAGMTYRHHELGLCWDVCILGKVGANDSWTHLTLGPFLHLLAPIGAGENGEIFFLKELNLENDDVASEEAEVTCYDPNTQMVRNLGLPIFRYGGTSAVVIYSESMVSLQAQRNN